ncbi:hypothetical protein [Haladaptatus sp.]|uniref:hypothetical protein n=1 Tax=Haladaptatus sp. TaxID=1973141 RepID=UPI003C5952A4
MVFGGGVVPVVVGETVVGSTAVPFTFVVVWFVAFPAAVVPEERFRDPNDTPDDKYPENPWADEYASGAFPTLAEQDVVLGGTPDDGKPNSSA